MEHDFEANFFTLSALLDPASRIEIDGACKKLTFEPGQLIYEQGEESNAVYIVSLGVVEAVTQSPDGRLTRSVAYMKKGDFFGDLGVLTAEPRLAMVRACEPTHVLQIEKLMFLRLLEKVPKLGAFFSRNLARRLHKTSTEAHRNVYSLDLSGNLVHFDLLTIFQAIMGMKQSGELQLNNTSNDLIGSFFFRKGQVEFARFAHLEGLEAIWQGFFEASAEGTFSFKIMEKPTQPFKEEHKISMDNAELLTQGTQRRDLYMTIPEPWRRMEGRIVRKGESLQWNYPETTALAERICELCAKRPQPLASLWRRLSTSSLTYLQVVGELIRTGHADLLPEETAEPEPAAPASKPEVSEANAQPKSGHSDPKGQPKFDVSEFKFQPAPKTDPVPPEPEKTE